jgi:hypothetical protein
MPVAPELTKPCFEPILEGRTGGHLVEAYLMANESIEQCNAQLKAIRESRDD